MSEQDPSELERVVAALSNINDLWKSQLGPGFLRTFNSKKGLSPKQLHTLLRHVRGKDINPNWTRIPMTLSTKGATEHLFDLDRWTVEELKPSMSKTQFEKWQSEWGEWSEEARLLRVKVLALSSRMNSPAGLKEQVEKRKEALKVVVRLGKPADFRNFAEMKIGDIFCRFSDLRKHIEAPEKTPWLVKTAKKELPEGLKMLLSPIVMSSPTNYRLLDPEVGPRPEISSLSDELVRLLGEKAPRLK